MSLKSTRGRFTKKQQLNTKSIREQLDQVKQTSMLSNIGRKPIFDGNVNLNIKKNENHRVEEKKISLTEHRKQISEKSDNIKSSSYDKYDFVHKKKKSVFRFLVPMIIVEALTLVAIFSFGYVVRLSKMTQQVPFNKEEVKNHNINEIKLEVMKGYVTAIVFGLDSRDGSVSKGNNADVNKIVHLNLETGELQIISLYRDMFLNISDNNTYGKLNSSYSHGGPERAVKAINKNLDLDINNYFTFNWKSVADVITLLGGIDIEITKSEYRFFNAFVHETCVATGIDAKNPAAHYIKSAGYHHLNGVQAVAYGRLRLMDSDFQRVDRQNRVLELAFQKAKSMDLTQLKNIIYAILPQIAYEFDMSKMPEIINSVKGITISNQYSCPELENLVMQHMGLSGDCIVPNSLETTVKKLHKVMYGDEDYNPSSAVKTYSNRITELRRQYKAQIEESIAESIEESKLAEEEKRTGVKKSTRSSANRSSTNNNSNNNSNNENNNEDEDLVVPIMDEENEEEPEEDVEIVNLPGETRRQQETRSQSNESNSSHSSSERIITNQSNTSNSSNSQGQPITSNSPNMPIFDNSPGSNNIPNSSNDVVISQNGPSSNREIIEPVVNPTANSSRDDVVIAGPPGT